ncbi:hypothetical protein LL912_12530 [Niabella sp. CC-SYL272]|uniref:hypothetical protein n=1 Tax=Niabella agricola TaxID=2891571 RepID=UPI001F2A2307|nr:hypothetical protein [Niabella agricola]MCF3109599.1 hypothetical protein [Niabella agricola]
MIFFRRKPRRETPLTDKAAGYFARNILNAQTKWATYMSRVTANWTPGQKTLALILFCGAVGANSGIALYKVINPTGERALAAVRTDHIRELRLQARDTLWDRELHKRMQAISFTIDSLSKTDSGRLLIRELKQSRPGLWDSIKIATGYYR